MVVGDGSDPGVMAQADLDGAVGFVAGTDNDTTNLSLVAAARRINPALFVAARQNRPASAPLFAAMEIDSLLVPTEVVAHEVYAQLSTPLLWRFLREMPAQGDDVGGRAHRPARRASAARTCRRCGRCGSTPEEAPALAAGWPPGGPGSATCCATRRTGTSRCTPSAAGAAGRRGDARPGRRLRAGRGRRAAARRLAGGPPGARHDAARSTPRREYVVTGRRVPSSWIWRRLTGTRAA